LFGEPFGLPPLRPFSALVRFFSSLSASGFRSFGGLCFFPMSERGTLFFDPFWRPANDFTRPSATACLMTEATSSGENSLPQCGHLIGINEPTF
jgi:hypothetical protein